MWSYHCHFVVRQKVERISKHWLGYMIAVSRITHFDCSSIFNSKVWNSMWYCQAMFFFSRSSVQSSYMERKVVFISSKQHSFYIQSFITLAGLRKGNVATCLRVHQSHQQHLFSLNLPKSLFHCVSCSSLPMRWSRPIVAFAEISCIIVVIPI